MTIKKLDICVFYNVLSYTNKIKNSDKHQDWTATSLKVKSSL